MNKDIVYIVIRYDGTSRFDSTKSTVWKVYEYEDEAKAACSSWNEMNDGHYYAYENWMVR